MIKHINANKCTGCGICFDICPMDVFRIHTIDEEEHRFNSNPELSKRRGHTGKAYIAYSEDCMTCFSCELQCPEHAIEVDFDRLIVPALNVLTEKKKENE